MKRLPCVPADPTVTNQPWVDLGLLARTRAAEPVRLPQGTLIAAFEVAGMARAWRAPITSASCPGGFTPKITKQWKETVARSAHESGYGEAAGVPPYPSLVLVCFWFCRKAPNLRSVGKRWGGTPDWDNLSKGLGDSVAGNVYLKPYPVVDENGFAVKKPNGKPKTVPTRFQTPAPTGRVIANDKLVTDAVVKKRYWTRAMAYIEVFAVDDLDANPFPFPR